jgi:hypothetical protein
LPSIAYKVISKCNLGIQQTRVCLTLLSFSQLRGVTMHVAILCTAAGAAVRRGVRRCSRTWWWPIEGTLRGAYSGNLFRELIQGSHSGTKLGNTQETLSSATRTCWWTNSGPIQGQFRANSGPIQGTFRELIQGTHAGNLFRLS